MKTTLCFLSVLTLFGCNQQNTAESPNIHYMPLLAGEVTQHSAILQARLTHTDTLIFEDVHDPEKLTQADVAGKKGIARFEIATQASYADPIKTKWLSASSAHDFIVKKKVDGLQPGTTYHYRLVYGEDSLHTKRSETHTFGTLPAADTATSVSFVMLACLHLERFNLGGGFGEPSSW